MDEVEVESILNLGTKITMKKTIKKESKLEEVKENEMIENKE